MSLSNAFEGGKHCAYFAGIKRPAVVRVELGKFRSDFGTATTSDAVGVQQDFVEESKFNFSSRHITGFQARTVPARFVGCADR